MANYPTLSVYPDFPIDPDGELSDVVIRSEVSGGYELTRPRTTRSRRSWGIKYSALPEADMDTLRTFEESTLNNGADLFTWTHPVSSNSYSVRLTAPIKKSYIASGLYSVSFVIKQV